MNDMLLTLDVLGYCTLGDYRCCINRTPGSISTATEKSCKSRNI